MARVKKTKKYNLGGTLGGLVGGAIGSAVAPGVGTIAGKAIGSALGAGIQNKVKPQNQATTFNPYGSTYADGGELTQYEGNKHEQGGIALGNTNNEVEGGETRNEDYIFSDRLKVSKGKTFADQSKKIENKYKRRSNDPFAKESKARELELLQGAQEAVRTQMVDRAIQKAYGGMVNKYVTGGNIPPYKQNDIYAPTNDNINNYGNDIPNLLGEVTVQGNKVKETPLNLEDSMFRADAGEIPSIQRKERSLSTPGSSKFPIQQQLISQGTNMLGEVNASGTNVGTNAIQPLTQRIQTPMPGSMASNVSNLRTRSPQVTSDATAANNINNAVSGVTAGVKNIGKNLASDLSGLSINSEGLPTDINIGNAGQFAATQMGNIYDIYRGLKGGSPVNIDRMKSVKSEQYDPTRAIQLQQEAGMGANELYRQQGGQGLGTYMSNVGAQTGRTQAGVATTQNAYDEANVGIRNADALNRQKVQAQNIELDMTEADLRQQEADIAKNTLQSGLAGLSSGLAVNQLDNKLDATQDYILRDVLGTEDYKFRVIDKTGNPKQVYQYNKDGVLKYYIAGTNNEVIEVDKQGNPIQE